MKQFLMTVAGVFVGLVLFLVGVPFLLIVMAASAARPAPVPAHTVLQLDLRGGLSDQDSQNPFAAFGGGGGQSVMSIIETLRRAETDDKVEAVLVRLPEGGMAPASADELRLAFKHFRAVGKKPIFAHSQGLYPSGLVTSTYMLGSAASEFWMQPDSSLQAVGASSEEMFFKRFFDKYGVKADYEQRYEYKNAVNPYLYSDYTPAHRESTLSWMGSVYTTALTTAAQDRKVDPAALIKTIEAGPYSAEEAKAKGLIDRVGQVKDAQDAMLARAGKGAKLMDFDDYVSRAKRAGQDRPDHRGRLGRGRDHDRQRRRRLAVRRRQHDLFRPGGQGPVRRHRRQGRQGDRLPGLLARRLRHRLGTDPGRREGRQEGQQARRGQHGHLCGLGRLLDQLGRLGDRRRAHHPDRLDRRVRRQVRPGRRPGAVRRRHPPGPCRRRLFGRVRHGQGFTPDQRAKFAAWMDRIYAGFVSRVAEGRKLPPNGCARSPRAGSGPASRPSSWAWSTSWAASTRPSRRPRAWPGSRAR
jgi:ClpP class serine protease